MLQSIVVICSFFLFLSSCDAQSSYSCNWTNPSTQDSYSFYPLMATKDYLANTIKYKYSINICRSTVITTCGSDVAGCQQWTGGKASIGKSSSANYVPLVRSISQGQKGATLKFSSGDGGRSFELDLQCDPNGGIGTPVFEIETPTNFYNFQWVSAYACPIGGSNGPSPPTPGGGGGLSGGGIFLILLFCLLVVYVAAGITYNVVKKKATGKEIIPNVEFWSALPGLVKDGVMFIVNSTCRRGSGYAQVH